jgi:hypothetical protein
VHGDPRRHTREHGERERPGHAKHDPRAETGSDEAEHGCSGEHTVMPVWGEVDRQHPAAGRPGDEAADAQVAACCDKKDRQSDRTDRATRLRNARAHATTTAHFAAWGPAVMYRR